jgi:lysophospholipase L1-like esterase
VRAFISRLSRPNLSRLRAVLSRLRPAELGRLRGFLSGTALLVVGVLIGVLIGPDVRGPGGGADLAAAVTHADPTSTGASSSATPTVGIPPTLPAVAKPAVPGAPSVFDPAQPVTIGFGDSITFNADSWFRQVCTGGVLMQNCLNAAIRGNTTTQMMARMESDVLIYQPAVVFVMGGTNDLKRHEDPQKILRRLDQMLDRARAVGATAVLCTIPPRNGGYGREVLALNSAIRRYAARGNVPLLDLYESVGTRKGTYKRGLTKDGIHPNLRASDLMTAAAEQQLPTLLHPVRDTAQIGRLDPSR